MAVSISSKNNDHLQRNANNCFNSVLCVPFAENNGIVTSRKLSDEDIHNLAHTEGRVTRPMALLETDKYINNKATNS